MIRLALAAMLALAPAAIAADGGSGSYSANGRSYDFDLANTGTTAWQYFVVVAPPGATIVGGATIGEITAHCVPGQPDGTPGEVECGPLSGTGIAPGAHVGFVATLGSGDACGAPFQLEVSSTAGATFTPVGLAAGTCTTPRALTPPRLSLVGHLLRATPPVWSDSPSVLSYRWQVCSGPRCRTIVGAHGLRLRVSGTYARHTVRLVATATVDGVDVTATSNALAVNL